MTLAALPPFAWGPIWTREEYSGCWFNGHSTVLVCNMTTPFPFCQAPAAACWENRKGNMFLAESFSSLAALNSHIFWHLPHPDYLTYTSLTDTNKLQLVLVLMRITFHCGFIILDIYKAILSESQQMFIVRPLELFQNHMGCYRYKAEWHIFWD